MYRACGREYECVHFTGSGARPNGTPRGSTKRSGHPKRTTVLCPPEGKKSDGSSIGIDRCVRKCSAHVVVVVVGLVTGPQWTGPLGGGCVFAWGLLGEHLRCCCLQVSHPCGSMAGRGAWAPGRFDGFRLWFPSLVSPCLCDVQTSVPHPLWSLILDGLCELAYVAWCHRGSKGSVTRGHATCSATIVLGHTMATRGEDRVSASSLVCACTISAHGPLVMAQIRTPRLAG